MRGKRAKAIRRRTGELLKALNIQNSEGYNEYEQLQNCVSWELAEGRDGKLLRDPDGGYIRAPKKTPGTVLMKWKLRKFFKWMKAGYKARDAEVLKILTASATELSKLSKVMGGNNG